MPFTTASGHAHYGHVALRHAATLVPRIRLHFLTRRIGKKNGVGFSVLKEVINAHRVYMELLLGDPRGRDAPELYGLIVQTYRVEVIDLARCSSLLRHGLLCSRLMSNEYDVAQHLCTKIPGGEAFAPFFSKIERQNK